MAEVKHILTVEAHTDAANQALAGFGQNAQKVGKDIPASFEPATQAVKKHGQEVSKLQTYYKAQQAEQRVQNFLFSEAKGAISAAGLALTLFSSQSKGSSGVLKDVSNSVNAGIVGFQGLAAVTGLLPGPWSLAISAIGGGITALLSLTDKTEKSTEAVRNHRDAVEAMVAAHDKLEAQLKSSGVELGVFTKAQLAATQENSRILQNNINVYREYLDQIVNGEKIQVRSAGFLVNTRKTGLETIADINKKFLQQSQTFQAAYNQALAEGKSKEDARTEGIRAARTELQDMVDRQNAFVAALTSTSAVASQNNQTLEGMRSRLENINKELANTPVGTRRFDELSAQARTLGKEIERVQGQAQSDFAFKFGLSLIRTLGDAKIQLSETDERLKEFKKSIGAGVENDTSLAVRVAIEADITKMAESLKTERELIDEWEQSVLDSNDATEEQKTRATQIASRRRSEIELQEIKKVTSQISSGFRQAFNVINQFSQQSSQARIDDIEAQKEAALGQVDAELENQNLTEEQRAQLLQKRKNMEAAYNEQVKAEKRHQFEADKQAKTIQAIIDTASAVVEALPNIPLSILAGALGLAQVALIQSQPVPRFAQGGQFIVPPGFDGDRFPMLVSSGERVTVETARQQQSTPPSVNQTFNFVFNSPVSNEQMVADAIEDRMRRLGVTNVNSAFRNSKAVISMN